MISLKHQYLLAVLTLLFLVLAGASVDAAGSKMGTTGISIGYRFESDDVDDGITFGAMADKQLSGMFAFFGVLDCHRLPSRWTRESSGSIGFVGSIGLKLRARPQEVGLRLIPGIAVGYTVLPTASPGSGQYAAVRLSLEVAHLTTDGTWYFLEYSMVQAFHGESHSSIWGHSLLSLRVGAAVASF